MQNLLDDTVNNEKMDLIVHAGDHVCDSGQIDKQMCSDVNNLPVL